MLTEEITKRHVQRLAKMNDDAIRALLGAWISELEPEIWYGPHGFAVGIGALGHNEPIIFLSGKIEALA